MIPIANTLRWQRLDFHYSTLRYVDAGRHGSNDLVSAQPMNMGIRLFLHSLGIMH